MTPAQAFCTRMPIFISMLAFGFPILNSTRRGRLPSARLLKAFASWLRHLHAVAVPRRALAAAMLMLLMSAAPTSSAQTSDATHLLFEVRVEQHVLTEALTAYRLNGELYLPLGELSRLLGIGIQTEPRQGIAHGYIIQEQRRFNLNVGKRQYRLAQQTGSFNDEDLLLGNEDIYASTSLLVKWLPVSIDVDLSRLLLQVQPLETLPLQARRAREQRAAQLERQMRDQADDYPVHPLPYRLFDFPFLDQTFSFNTRRAGTASESESAYTALATGDLLGMEASLYVSQGNGVLSPQPRLTLARHDPQAGLLGALGARSLELGSIVIPGIAHVSRDSDPGYGLRLSNRPLTLPQNFSRHTVQGDLPPGWEVELYFNDALLGLQRADADGRFRFDDLPLIFGLNEFRLVFYGPLGQVRVERQRILLEPSLVRPGEFFYSVAKQQDDHGRQRASFQFDAGISESLVGSAGISSLPMTEEDRHYVNLGLRSFWKSFILSGDFAASDNGGRLAELEIKTRIGDMGLQLSRAQLSQFVSEVFAAANDPIRTRDRLRLEGAIAALPGWAMALEARQDGLQSGNRERELNLRLSGAVGRTDLSHTLSRLSTVHAAQTHGILRLSRRVADIGLSGQVAYQIKPQSSLSAAQFTADKSLGNGYRLNLALTRSYPARDLQTTVGLTKSLGRYGLQVHASHIRDKETAIGLQLFVALGREPRRGEWLSDAQPIAHTGAASMQVFLDHNQNGVRDEGEEAVRGAGFMTQGSKQPVKTDADGIALLPRLPTRRHVDIALDSATLEDPQWSAQRPGVRLLPRPGRVAEINMPVVVTADIEGTVYLEDEDGRRGIGDAIVELVDHTGQALAQTKSAVDGVYVMQGVAPGTYVLRISPSQAERLNLTSSPAQEVTIRSGQALIKNRDFMLSFSR